MAAHTLVKLCEKVRSHIVSGLSFLSRGSKLLIKRAKGVMIICILDEVQSENNCKTNIYHSPSAVWLVLF